MLALLSGEDACVSTGLLPQTHIAIVPASRVVGGLEDGFALMRTARGQLHSRSVAYRRHRTHHCAECAWSCCVHAVVVRDA